MKKKFELGDTIRFKPQYDSVEVYTESSANEPHIYGSFIDDFQSIHYFKERTTLFELSQRNISFKIISIRDFRIVGTTIINSKIYTFFQCHGDNKFELINDEPIHEE